MKLNNLLTYVPTALFITSPAQAVDLVSTKSIGMELARDIATETILVCRKKG